MSARVESTPIHDSYSATIAIAIVVALAVGALLGTVVTKAIDDGSAAVATPVGARLWDSQKLGAMEGRALAERYRIAQPVAWDEQKLEAMAGRVLAAQAGAEDPPVKPHLPTHLPKRPRSG